MPTDKSVAEVEELKILLREANLIISTDYRGLNVTQMSALRNAVREGGGTYRVAKNTLVKIASEAIGRPEISEIVVGPTGFVLSTDDPVAPTRALVTHIQQNRLEVVINGAYLDGKVVDADRVKFLATLPDRDELVARVLSQMNAPIANLVGVLSGTIRGLLTVLLARIDQSGNVAAGDQAEVSDNEPAEAPAAEIEASEEASTEQAEGSADEPAEPPADEPDAADVETSEAAPSDQAEDSADEPAEPPADESDAADVEASEEAQTEQAEDSAEEPVTEATAEEESTPVTKDPGEADEDKPAE
ncbi:MAG: 50S ribosomal protein L10 [Chloroflexi bacterium]|nr:50S ribosomal protein L10 [Chloroflexota bacterium]